MRGVKIAAAVATVACGLVLAGCRTTTEVRRTVAASSSAPAASSSAPVSSPAASSPAAVPSPDDQQQLALVTKLQLIDPGLVADVDSAVDYGRNVCQYVKAGDTAGAQKYAVSRAAADGVTIDDSQGAGVVAAVQAAFCS